MRVRTKLYVSYGVIGLLLAVVAAVAVEGTGRTREAFNEISGSTLPTLNALQELRGAGLRIVAASNETVVNPRAGAGALQSYQQALAQLSALALTQAGARDEFSAIRRAGQQLQAASDALMRARLGHAGAAVTLTEQQLFATAEQNFLEQVAGAIEREQSLFTLHEQAAVAIVAHSRAVILLLGLLIFAVVLVAGMLTSHLTIAAVVELRGIVGTLDVDHDDAPGAQPLRAAERRLEQAASRRRPIFRDEVTDLALAFARLLARLRLAYERIASHQQGLEKQVAERTADLEVARQQAEQLAQRAMAADEARSHFLANMSHEIRTPMNGVLGMTELLLATPLNENQRRMAQTIESSGELLLGIINDILDFSRTHAGNLVLDHAPFDLRKVVEESLELLAARAHLKGLDVICDMPIGLQSAFHGDALRLRQVLVNLIGNAVKFTDRGHVVVRVSEVDRDQKTRRLRFEVEDTGVGIAVRNQPRVFDMFYQEDASAKRRGSGTGLGLAIVKQLVELMHGEIGVHSRPGEGSTFWFTVCLETAEPTDMAIQLRMLESARVLVVDDNDTNREILKHQLESWGISVGEAPSGPAAMQALLGAAQHGARYDLALLDWHMPDMDGMALARAVRSNDSLKRTPLIMLSSAASAGGVEETRALFEAMLSKPVRQAQLYECVGSVLAHAEQAPAPVPAPLAPGSRVLLVEDNAVNIAVAEGMLESLRCVVSVARDGREAVTAFQREPHAAVLMDCQMPTMDGYEATQVIRQWERMQGRAATPIVALTANATPADRQRCLEVGMNDFLTKPFSRDQLSAVLAKSVAAPSGSGLPGGQPTGVAPVDGAAPSASAAASPAAASPAVAEAPEGPAIDWTTLEELALVQIPGQPSLRDKLIRLYIDTSRPLVQGLEQAVARADAAAITTTAHPLKSSSANVGAKGLGALCGRLESAARQGELRDAAALLTRIMTEYERVVAELRAVAPQPDAAPLPKSA